MNCVFANTIYTGKSIVYDNYLVFNGKNISSISKSAKGELLGHFDVLTPAFIDPHSHIGMQRSGEPSGEGEANDQLDSILVLTDALDSVQMGLFYLLERRSLQYGALSEGGVRGRGITLFGIIPGKKIESLAAQSSDLIGFNPENQARFPFHGCKCPIN